MSEEKPIPSFSPNKNKPSVGTAGGADRGVGMLFNGLRSLSLGQKLAMAAVGLLLMVGLAALVSRGPGNYRVLFTNVNDADGASIVAELAKMNVPYKFTEGGGAILVPESKVYETRLKLAGQGLPRSGTVGFEVLENQKLGTSQFVERVNYQRALEGELARSVASLSQVKSARVHLAIPKPTAFVREKERPTASVVLKLHPGASIDTTQAIAISRLVSSAVPGIEPQDVSILDTSGNMLTPGGQKSVALDASQLKYTAEIESALNRRLSVILEPIAGKDGFRAQVTVDMNFDERERTSESYSPNSPPKPQSIRSEQISSSGGRRSSTGGIPGALTNQPPQPPEAPIVNQVQANERSRLKAPGAIETEPVKGDIEPFKNDRTTNYELDRAIERLKVAPGRIRRVSAAVALDYKAPSSGVSGAAKQPYSQEELEKISELVRDAIGYVQRRGDRVSVVNMPFNTVAVEPLGTSATELPSELMSEVLRYLAIGLGILLAYLFLVKPIAKAFASQSEKTPVVTDQLGDEESQAEMTRRALSQEEEAWMLKQEVESSREKMRQRQLESENLKKENEEASRRSYYENLVTYVKQFAQSKSRETTLVLKDWLSQHVVTSSVVDKSSEVLEPGKEK